MSLNHVHTVQKVQQTQSNSVAEFFRHMTDFSPVICRETRHDSLRCRDGRNHNRDSEEDQGKMSQCKGTQNYYLFNITQNSLHQNVIYSFIKITLQ